MRKGLARILVDHAEKHGGVLARPDALRLGADRRFLSRMMADDRLVRVHPGVYALPGRAGDHDVLVRAAIAATRRAHPTATNPTTATNPSAVASHLSAAWLQGLVERPPAVVELTICGDRRRLHGVTVHQSERRPGTRRFAEVACTVPARTLVDLAGRLPSPALADAVDRALTTAIMRPADLEGEIAASGGRRGVARLRPLLDACGVTAITAGALESRMARLLAGAGLTGYQAQHQVFDGRYRIDYAFPGPRVAVELYGYAWHRSPEQMAYDQARQRRLVLAGWRVLVFTWLDVATEPERVIDEIVQAVLIPA